MWCDNCLLLLPLRGGAMAWAIIIALYSIAGGIFLLIRGQFLYFTYPEWYIYGGIGVTVGGIAIITFLALSNRSYIWTRVCKFVWPFIVVISAIRAILMIVELQRGKSNIVWECQNGGQLWNATTTATNTITTTTETSETFPAGFCSAGFSSIYVVFIVALLIDLVFQIYMYFMTWRYQKRLEHYASLKGPFAGGYYNA